MPTHNSLAGRVALVTGVSRDIGIAATIARRLHELGATVHATGWPQHDAEMPWGEQPLSALPFPVARHDLEDAVVAQNLIDEVVDLHGRIDIVAAVHARSTPNRPLTEVSMEEFDRCWAANVRSVIALAQRFAQCHEPAAPTDPPTGRIIWFTSGQHLQPMDTELAYAVSKGALHQMAASVNQALSEFRIIANCINPGPVDTGYLTGEAHAEIASWFPDGRWGTPDDVANLVEFLVGDNGAWIRGQVIDSEGGFDRFSHFR